MTDEEARALGRRLVACEGFRWVPGMANMWGDRVVRSGSLPVVWSDVASTADRDGVGDDVPDLRDPATRGCVLELVRERHGPTTVIEYWRASGESDDPRPWIAFRSEPSGSVGFALGATEAEALVAALEAAP